MTKPRPLPDYDELHRIFDYNPETGLLKTKVSRRRTKIGDEPGFVNNLGYKVVKIDYLAYFSHRIIYKMMTGTDPIGVDHINGVRDDNRWCNLRECTQQQNTYNKVINPQNKIGTKCISKVNRKNPYRVRVRVNGIRINVGSFKTLEQAEQAYKEFVDKHHGEFANYG